MFFMRWLENCKALDFKNPVPYYPQPEHGTAEPQIIPERCPDNVLDDIRFPCLLQQFAGSANEVRMLFIPVVFSCPVTVVLAGRGGPDKIKLLQPVRFEVKDIREYKLTGVIMTVRDIHAGNIKAGIVKAFSGTPAAAIQIKRFHFGTFYNNRYHSGQISSDSKYNDDRDNRGAAASLVLCQSSSFLLASLSFPMLAYTYTVFHHKQVKGLVFRIVYVLTVYRLVLLTIDSNKHDAYYY